MKKTQGENRWGVRSLSGPVEYPAFTIQLADWKESEGPGNLSSTDHGLVVSDGEVSIEIGTTNRRGTDLFEFRGQEYVYQIYDDDDGFSCTVFPVTVGPGGT
jgi:hypothetical protein